MWLNQRPKKSLKLCLKNQSHRWLIRHLSRRPRLQRRLHPRMWLNQRTKKSLKLYLKHWSHMGRRSRRPQLSR